MESEWFFITKIFFIIPIPRMKINIKQQIQGKQKPFPSLLLLYCFKVWSKISRFGKWKYIVSRFNPKISTLFFKEEIMPEWSNFRTSRVQLECMTNRDSHLSKRSCYLINLIYIFLLSFYQMNFPRHSITLRYPSLFSASPFSGICRTNSRILPASPSSSQNSVTYLISF